MLSPQPQEEMLFSLCSYVYKAYIIIQKMFSYEGKIYATELCKQYELEQHETGE